MAPRETRPEVARAYAVSRLGWIRKQQAGLTRRLLRLFILAGAHRRSVTPYDACEVALARGQSERVGLGTIPATLQTLAIGIELVTPAVWKRALGLSADKRASLDKARLLFPSADLRLAKHEGGARRPR